MAPSLNADKNTPSSCGLAPALVFVLRGFSRGASPKSGRESQSYDSKQDVCPAVVEKMVRPCFVPGNGACSPAKKA